ncbi:unnamed protein product [Gongylonema pulchrum]|uniref:HCO3_cotransp domain-containing protein n=1 Tax=Gongylonema pulchrum TaxID=637853 RepID=A0A183DQ54_9BILA|nr:unnamed protein product [Gongylonema pulchrum]
MPRSPPSINSERDKREYHSRLLAIFKPMVTTASSFPASSILVYGLLALIVLGSIQPTDDCALIGSLTYSD